MIGHLTGKVISKKPTKIIVDVNGVGYLVNISLSTFDRLPEESEKVSLHTYLIVREDVLDLYGFLTIAEKEMFELLISISGVGPKLAQGILSGIQIQELKEALRNGNLSRIIAIPGVGRKTGERLITELREKVDKLKASSITVTSGFNLNILRMTSSIGVVFWITSTGPRIISLAFTFWAKVFPPIATPT